MSMAEGPSAAVDEDMEGQVASEQRLSCVQVGGPRTIGTIDSSIHSLCSALASSVNLPKRLNQTLILSFVMSSLVCSLWKPLRGLITDDIFPAYDDKLELLAVMQRLREELESSLPQDGVGTVTLDLHDKVHMVVDRLATNLDSAVENEQKRAGSLQLFRRLVHVLLDGRTIGLEDVIDVLTLKDWPPAGGDGGIGQSFIEGLVLMARSGLKELPSGRKLNALRAIWRRVYICDKCARVLTHIFIPLTLLPPVGMTSQIRRGVLTSRSGSDCKIPRSSLPSDNCTLVHSKRSSRRRQWR